MSPSRLREADSNITRKLWSSNFHMCICVHCWISLPSFSTWFLPPERILGQLLFEHSWAASPLLVHAFLFKPELKRLSKPLTGYPVVDGFMSKPWSRGDFFIWGNSLMCGSALPHEASSLILTCLSPRVQAGLAWELLLLILIRVLNKPSVTSLNPHVSCHLVFFWCTPSSQRLINQLQSPRGQCFVTKSVNNWTKCTSL